MPSLQTLRTISSRCWLKLPQSFKFGIVYLSFWIVWHSLFIIYHFISLASLIYHFEPPAHSVSHRTKWLILDKPARLIKRKWSTNSETAMLSCLYRNCSPPSRQRSALIIEEKRLPSYQDRGCLSSLLCRIWEFSGIQNRLSAFLFIPNLSFSSHEVPLGLWK